jgi:hypothetical protein
MITPIFFNVNGKKGSKLTGQLPFARIDAGSSIL